MWGKRSPGQGDDKHQVLKGHVLPVPGAAALGPRSWGEVGLGREVGLLRSEEFILRMLRSHRSVLSRE